MKFENEICLNSVGGISLEWCGGQPEEASPVHSDSRHQAADQSGHPDQPEGCGVEGNSG